MVDALGWLELAPACSQRWVPELTATPRPWLTRARAQMASEIYHNLKKIIKGKYTKIPEDHPADENLKKLVGMCLTHDCALRPSVSDVLSLDFVQEQVEIHGLELPEAIPRCERRVVEEEKVVESEVETDHQVRKLVTAALAD